MSSKGLRSKNKVFNDYLTYNYLFDQNLFYCCYEIIHMLVSNIILHRISAQLIRYYSDLINILQTYVEKSVGPHAFGVIIFNLSKNKMKNAYIE